MLPVASQHFKTYFIGYGTENVFTSTQFISIKGSQQKQLQHQTRWLVITKGRNPQEFFSSHSK